MLESGIGNRISLSTFGIRGRVPVVLVARQFDRDMRGDTRTSLKGPVPAGDFWKSSQLPILAYCVGLTMKTRDSR